MSEPILRARDLAMVYGQGVTAVHALSGVSIDIRAGELLMIRGPSGSGKSTLLQLVGALQRPTAGTLSLYGCRIEALRLDQLRRIRVETVGFVFQNYNLFPTLKAWENVAVALDLLGWGRPAAEERARALLHDFGLASRADFFPSAMSGGQRQRVAIARALAHDPAMILADEPTAALDRESGAMVTEWLRVLAHDQKRAVVVVSHDARLEPRVDRIVTIEDGRLTNAGSPLRSNHRSGLSPATRRVAPEASAWSR